MKVLGLIALRVVGLSEGASVERFGVARAVEFRGPTAFKALSGFSFLINPKP